MTSISLKKGQRISLSKDTGTPGLSKIFLGLGWDPVEQPKQKTGWFGRAVEQEKKEIDLDASVILFDEHGNVVDTVWFRQLTSRDGSIRHSGDNRTGKGDGDDERIYVDDLARVPTEAKSMVFVINSYLGQNFSEIERAVCRLVDQTTGKELASLVLSERGPHTAALMVSVYRANDGWELKTIAETGHGRTVEQLIDLARKHI